MKQLTLIALFLLAALSMLALAASKPEPEQSTQVVFVVRHADTSPGEDRDPDLNERGIERAKQLASLLANEPLDAIFVTNTERSRQTAAPIALAFTLAPTQYPATDAESLREMIMQLPANTTALVVAHSNTVTMINEALGAPSVGDIPHDEFSHLYAIVLSNGEHVRTITLRIE